MHLLTCVSVDECEQVPQTPQLQLTETIRNDVNLKKQVPQCLYPSPPPVLCCLSPLVSLLCRLCLWYVVCGMAGISACSSLSYLGPSHLRLSQLLQHP